MKSLKDIITEAIHKGPMPLYEIIHVLVKEYNMSWLTAKEHPEFAKFLPYSKIEDLDVARTTADERCGIAISAGSNEKSFGMGLHYISTEKSQYGDGTRRREIDWTSMSKDTLQNLVICLRKILNDVEVDIEKVYTKHPKAKDLESEITNYIRRQTPRNFYTRNIEVGATVRELTKDDKKAGFDYIIDIEVQPKNPQRRLSIGIDKNNCLRWTEQYGYDECENGFETPQFLIKWIEVEGKVASMLQSY